MGVAGPQVVDLRDAATFRAFYADMMPRVYSFAFHRCGGNVAVSEDVTQETFAAAVKAIRSGAVPDDARRWLFGLARHKLYDYFRKQSREDRKLELARQAAPLDDPPTELESPTRERTLAALAAMPAAQRSAVALRYLDEMSVPEIASAIGRSVHATESLLARGRESFRRAYLEAADA